MKTAEFEEKEYEGPLYNQLEAGCPHLWSPGQVFEHHIGIDRAMMINNARFWRLLARSIPRGAVLSRYPWDLFPQSHRTRPLPSFRLNLFIQAKRPKSFKQPPRHIRNAGLTGRGWCFDVDAHQQSALEVVATQLGSKAAVVYASPAFHSLLHLYRHTNRSSIIDHSTFPDVARLRGHTRWFYNRAGGDGVANPDAEPTEGPSIFERIEKLRGQGTASEDGNPGRELYALSKSIVTALREGELEDNPRAALFFQELGNIEREIRQYEQIGDAIRPFMEVSAFAESFNVEWLTIS